MHGDPCAWHDHELATHAVDRDACIVLFEDETRGSVITVQRSQPSADMYACIERLALHEVHCDEDHPSVLTFTYVY